VSQTSHFKTKKDTLCGVSFLVFEMTGSSDVPAFGSHGFCPKGKNFDAL